MISQLSVFLENKEGHLAKAIGTLSDAGINMQALFLADSRDFGIVRIFCDTPNAALKAMNDAGYRAKLVDVTAIKVPDEPGALAKLMSYLDDKDIDIAYAYCFKLGNDAIDVLKIDRPAIETELAAAGFTVCKPEDVYEIG